MNKNVTATLITMLLVMLLGASQASAASQTIVSPVNGVQITLTYPEVVTTGELFDVVIETEMTQEGYAVWLQALQVPRGIEVADTWHHNFYCPSYNINISKSGNISSVNSDSPAYSWSGTVRYFPTTENGTATVYGTSTYWTISPTVEGHMLVAPAQTFPMGAYEWIFDEGDKITLILKNFKATADGEYGFTFTDYHLAWVFTDWTDYVWEEAVATDFTVEFGVTAVPPGWDKGKKKGWESNRPPGLQDKDLPSGFDNGEKTGWSE